MNAASRAAGAELRFATLAGLAAAMALATVAFYDPLPVWLPLPLLALMVWRLRWAWRGGPTPRVPRLLKLSVLAVLGFALWASGRFGIGIDGMGAGFIVLLWLKMLELNAPRDLQYTCAIALFLVALQLLLSQSLGQCLLALASALALLAVLVHYHIAGTAASGFDDRRPWRTWARSWRTAGALGLQSLPFALALFICVPRPPATGFDRQLANSGVSDSLAPGSVAKVALNPAPAFRVEFASGTPPVAECYWRGIVLWNTDGETWGRGPSLEASHPPPLADTGSAAEIEYDITLQPQNQRWIYTLDCPLGVSTPAGADDAYLKKTGYVYETRRPIGTTRVYHARSLPRAEPRDPYQPRFSADDRYTRVNDRARLEAADPRFARLVAELSAKAAGPDGRFDARRDAQRAVDAAHDWFRANGFVYTLEPGEMGPNPTGTFLFERRRGFCEHFANAFGVVMRLMGVPSRVVVGYLGGEINLIGGFMTVRQANAHAWNEVWVDGSWRRVDATGDAVAVDAEGNPIPQASQGDPTAFGAAGGRNWMARHLRWMIQRWDYAEAQWDRWALAYDQDSLAALQRMLGLQRLGIFGPALMFLGAALPALALVLWLMRRRRRAADPTVAHYAAFCERLARVGVARGPAEGPLDLARRACAALPAQDEAIRRIVGEYAELRYGPALPAPARRANLARLARDVRAFKPRRVAVEDSSRR